MSLSESNTIKQMILDADTISEGAEVLT